MLNVVDVFCGAGGLSRGFMDAGFNVIAAVDADPIACETYAINHPNTEVVCDNVENIKWRHLAMKAPGGVHMVIGGPSCQGFSTHGKRDPDDPRNFLFTHFIRAVTVLRPAWVVMENVKGLLTYDKGRYRDQILTSFRRIGYNANAKLLLAADYGVPQLRERLFFLATNTGIPIDFPQPTHAPADKAGLLGLKPYVTVGEAIGDLPAVGCAGAATAYVTRPTTGFQRYARAGAPRHLTLHQARHVSDFAMKIIRQIPPGHGLRYLPERKLPERFRKMRTISSGALRRDCTTLYYRLSKDRPAYTITCYFTNVSSGPFVHPDENRALTPREAARLQTFRDSYQFTPSKLPRQIGNAVPPLLAQAVARHIAKKVHRAQGNPKAR